ncbi:MULTISPECIES: coproporphyrinogen-III oxidase family protein [unclassified Treponema]|uniref:coproporphyrinogen-III oxidase family protein n=1 Tax=unclassified Treponema TaxID=2638727 RepID=UPI0020A3F587|nr:MULTISPECIES: coproporphyrinogen-III oxidase family protein [unclassified Treponema]UTC68157.1 coproporphyrinogen III oxidase family protein [Treponema sp. OMZ 789]UTC71189.1 coproporphyrinogen III oxidase family protein [Treponema sp. OMZ 790]UTC73906.1 coproporphyrinogen III oxidase family protein [Treponema sp. OMZ 791]
MRKAGLYIHIPFCLQKCNYCDFFSVQAGRFTDILSASGVSPFALRLMEDIKIQAKKYDVNEWDTVYIGGGTPSLLSPDDLYFISSQIIKEQKNPPAEFTVEINPEDLNKDFLTAAVHGGINRFSVGIQSLSDEVLKECKRRGGRKTSLSALGLLRSQKGLILSCDLIAGLNNQTFEVLKDDIEILVNFKPEHFSLYALCSNTKISSEKDDEIAALWSYGKGILEQNGYNKYEVSNFSYKNLYKSIHNEKYWRLQDYIGVGPGAFGTVFFDKSTPPEYSSTHAHAQALAYAHAYALRFSACKNITKWMQCKNRDDVYEYETIAEKEFIEEAFMMGLRLTEGMDRAFFKSRFGKDITAFAGKTILKWADRNEAVLTDKSFYLNEKGFTYLNIFLQEVFQEIDTMF